MDLKKIITVSGEPELFLLINSNPKGIIVEGIESQKRKQIYSYQRINSLEDIAIYTQTGEVPLKEIFVRMYKHLEGQKAIDSQSTKDQLAEFFESFFPEYDKERFLDGAMKKVVKWYNMLVAKGLVDDKEPETEEQIENKTE